MPHSLGVIGDAWLVDGGALNPMVLAASTQFGADCRNALACLHPPLDNVIPLLALFQVCTAPV